MPHRPPKPVRETLAYRWSRTIQRRPWLWVVAGTVFLLALAAPVFGLRLGFSDEGNLAEDTYTRQAYDLLAEGFGAGFNGPFIITVVPGDGDSVAAVDTLQQALAETPGVAAVTPAFPNHPAAPEAYLINLVPTTAPQDAATTELVTHACATTSSPPRSPAPALDVKVTGTAAANIDFTDFLAGRIPVFFGAVLALSFLLLMVVFRSLLVPLKAVVMNVLSIGATYGVLVAIFQWGWGADLIGIDTGPIEAIVPLMLFAIVFGLSMDYEVFLLSRIREEYDKTGDSATRRRRRPRQDRTGHHRRRRHHGRRLRLVRVRRRPDRQAVRHRLRRSPSCSTPPSSACCSCRPPWSSSATRTGGCPSGSTGSSPSSTSTAPPTTQRRPVPSISPHRTSNPNWPALQTYCPTTLTPRFPSGWDSPTNKSLLRFACGRFSTALTLSSARPRACSILTALSRFS